jgi:hypothetical protein
MSISTFCFDYKSPFKLSLLNIHNEQLKKSWFEFNTGDLFIIIDEKLNGYRQSCSVLGYAYLFGYMKSNDRYNDSIDMFLKSEYRLYIDFIYNQYKSLLTNENKLRILYYYEKVLIEQDMKNLKL